MLRMTILSKKRHKTIIKWLFDAKLVVEKYWADEN
jgi:hypothetical protein